MIVSQRAISKQNRSEVPGTVPVRVSPPRVPWWRRVPSLTRLVLFSLFVFLFALGVLVGGIVYIRNVVPLTSQTGDGSPISSITTFTEFPGRITFRDRDRINMLVLGIDYNYTRQGILYTTGARSDTMFVVSLDPEADFLNVLSIPRDTQVFISEEFGYDKINGAFALGGIEQATETVSEFLGVPIDHYLLLKVQGAEKLVDALGGLAVDVEKDMDYDDNWGNLHIHLKKGPQILNGQQAVGYARFRMDEEGDRGRIRRQQQVIRALVEKLRDTAVVTRLDEIAAIVKENVETDLKMLEMADLANLYHGFDFHSVRGGAIVGDDDEANGITFIVPYGPENERSVRRLLKDPAWLAVEDLRVRVLNGSRDGRAGDRVANRLELEGFQVLAVDTAGRRDYDRTQVIDHLKIPRTRGLIASLLPGADFQEDLEVSTDEAPYDLTVIIGNDLADYWGTEDLKLEPEAYPTHIPLPPVEQPPDPGTGTEILSDR